MCNLIRWLFGKRDKKENKINETVATSSVQKEYNDINVKSPIVYERKSYMTMCEYSFYNKLASVFAEKYIVAAQVPLSSVIRKKSDARFQSELYRIVDFALVDKVTMEIKLLIELNDKSHFEKNRQYRDFRVKEICGEANIPLLTFWTHYDNEISYVKNRIEKTLSEAQTSDWQRL